MTYNYFLYPLNNNKYRNLFVLYTNIVCISDTIRSVYTNKMVHITSVGPSPYTHIYYMHTHTSIRLVVKHGILVVLFRCVFSPARLS